ncbi:MAG: VWA domain-containing protein [Planctomycetia bacterium]|nr:VWA domain-containing protein [Planctomycetia bacterium]
MSVSSDAAVAASGIVTQIQGDLAEGQTYVVWLLDASISLLESRKVLAKTLEPFLSEHRPAPGKQGNLITAVVAYGAGVQMVADYSPLGNYGDIERLPIDPSGRENVMSAIIAVVNGFQTKFHKDPRRRDRLRIVIWTDESGDDNRLLEDVIALCRATGTVVHVVGPSSALGSDRGLQPWFDKKTKGVYLLPVTRGPDSYLTERVLLPYWFDTDADAGEFDGVLVADGREWYGGPLRESLLSGVGPYALTRLALQTGGTIRLLDRPGEDRRFDLATMKDYLPEYASAAEIVEPILASPFRLGILQAVRATYDPVNLTPPRMAFVEAQRSRSYPFRFTGGAYVE